MEKGGECLQLLFLIEIDVQLFIVQPFIGIDADIDVSVGVDDEGVGGVFVSVGFEDFLPTVIGWVTTAGEVGNGRYCHDGFGILVPSHNQIADLSFAPVDKAVIETVVLLSHKKADSYIHIDVEFGEGEGKIPVDSIAKRAEAYKPKEKVTYKMIKEYIEAKYGFKVHTAYIAEVKRDLGLPMYDAPNAVEELKQPRKHPTAEKVEAIKDALRYFAVI